MCRPASCNGHTKSCNETQTHFNLHTLLLRIGTLRAVVVDQEFSTEDNCSAPLIFHALEQERMLLPVSVVGPTLFVLKCVVFIAIIVVVLLALQNR